MLSSRNKLCKKILTKVPHLSRHLGGRLEQRANVNVVAKIRKARSNDLGAAVVAVLTHLGDQHARATTLLQEAGGKKRDKSGSGSGSVRLDLIIFWLGWKN